MQYKIESIGAEFNDKQVKGLGDRLTAHAKDGYEFHSVFQVQQPSGCFGFKPATITNLAIYVKK